MLKQNGFSLFEMLLSISISSLIFIGTSSFYSKLQSALLQQNLNIHLQKNIHQGLASIAKDLKRAGFIANQPEKMKKLAIEINTLANCLVVMRSSLRSFKSLQFCIPIEAKIEVIQITNKSSSKENPLFCIISCYKI